MRIEVVETQYTTYDIDDVEVEGMNPTEILTYAAFEINPFDDTNHVEIKKVLSEVIINDEILPIVSDNVRQMFEYYST